jgi:hypothetical protein
VRALYSAEISLPSWRPNLGQCFGVTPEPTCGGGDVGFPRLTLLVGGGILIVWSCECCCCRGSP